MTVETGGFVVCRGGGIWRMIRTDSSGCTLKEQDTGFLKELAPDTDEIIRPIASREVLLDAVSRVGYIHTIQAPNDKLRRELYEEAMAQYDEIEWIRVIKTVYLRGQEMPLSPEESAYGEQAKTLFSRRALRGVGYINGSGGRLHRRSRNQGFLVISGNTRPNARGIVRRR